MTNPSEKVAVEQVLKPCPFCGEPPLLEDGRNDRPWVVQCINQECFAQPFMDHADTKRRAITAWNTRTSEPTGVERAQIVAWLREQSDIGADHGNASDKGSTRRAAYGGGSLALDKAADAIERGDHLSASPSAESGAGDGERYRRMLLELLAVIHRDGGHKTQELGLFISYQQALRISSERLAAYGKLHTDGSRSGGQRPSGEGA